MKDFMKNCHLWKMEYKYQKFFIMLNFRLSSKADHIWEFLLALFGELKLLSKLKSKLSFIFNNLFAEKIKLKYGI